jgi:hypothetical protein
VGAEEPTLARPPEKRHGVELDHDVGGKSSGEHEDRRGERQKEIERRGEETGCREPALEKHPFGDEPSQGRDAGERGGADEGRDADPRHARQKTSELPEIALARRVKHRPRREEKQAFPGRVIETEVETCREGEGGEGHLLGARKEQREAEGGGDEPDVLDRRIGEQAFDVALGRGVKGAVKTACRSEGEDGGPPPGHEFRTQNDDETHEAVEGDFEHHTAHEGRDGRGGGGMSFGQPHVGGQEAGFGPESPQRAKKNEARPKSPGGIAAHRGEVEDRPSVGEDAEGDQKKQGAHLGHDQVDQGGPADVFAVVFAQDEGVGSEGHELPGRHERERIVGQQDHGERREEKVVGKTEDAGGCALTRAEIAAGENRDREDRHTEQRKEHASERSGAKQKLEPRRTREVDDHCGQRVESGVDGRQGEDQPRHGPRNVDRACQPHAVGLQESENAENEPEGRHEEGDACHGKVQEPCRVCRRDELSKRSGYYSKSNEIFFIC